MARVNLSTQEAAAIANLLDKESARLRDIFAKNPESNCYTVVAKDWEVLAERIRAAVIGKSKWSPTGVSQ